MGVNAARRGLAAPSRRITAYLRLLGRRRPGPSGLGSLRDEIGPRVRALAADALGVEPDRLTDDVALENDLAVDSLDLLELLARVEETFEVTVPDREAAAIHTVDELIAVTTALVACRVRTRDATLAPATRFAVRIGAEPVPRFLRAVGAAPYEQELLREDVRHARPDDPVLLSAAEAVPPPLDRTLLRASLAGADVRTESGPAAAPEPSDDGARAWAVERLATVWEALQGRLAAERDAAPTPHDRRGRSGAAAPAEARAATNAEVARFRAVVETYLPVLGEVRPAIHAVARELGRLDLARRAADERAGAEDRIRGAYDVMADALADAAGVLRSSPHERSALRRGPHRIARRPEREELRA